MQNKLALLGTIEYIMQFLLHTFENEGFSLSVTNGLLGAISAGIGFGGAPNKATLFSNGCNSD